MNAAIYIRVSTLDQAEEGYSLDAQRRVLTAWCIQRGYDPPIIYEDAGISGKDIKHRPAMQKLLVAIREDKYDAVVVWALSRLTRRVADLYGVWEIMEAHGCELISHTEVFDTSTPVGRAMMGILGVFAQFERENTIERVKVAMQERALQGKRTCSEVLGYDKTPEGLEINKREAQNVLQIYSVYQRTGSLTETARWCREHGIRGKRGKVLDAYKVRVILTRPIYAGYYSYKELRIRGDFPALVSVEKYNAVVRRINAEQRGRKAVHIVPLINPE
ncbi:MAG: hypothetical protein DBX91_08350 [Subdoligranulum variabile]|nr:MAG: hypothetical protein DBX91_08350 [Subdoligranulum variabile]